MILHKLDPIFTMLQFYEYTYFPFAIIKSANCITISAERMFLLKFLKVTNN